MKTLPILLICLSGFLLCSCATTEKRIEKNAELFSTFSAENQALIRDQKIAIGFTPQMVEIAKGKPSDIKVRKTSDREIIIWRYLQYQQYTYTQPALSSGRYGGPDFITVTDTREKEILRVEFLKGKVISFEQNLP